MTKSISDFHAVVAVNEDTNTTEAQYTGIGTDSQEYAVWAAQAAKGQDYPGDMVDEGFDNLPR